MRQQTVDFLNQNTIVRTVTTNWQKTTQQQHMTKSDNGDEIPTDKKMIEGFGVGEKSQELRGLVESDEDIDLCVPAEDLVVPKEDNMECPSEPIKTTPTLSPMALLRFIAPTLALWIAPPVMSLIDTIVVGRFCGANDLAALNPGCTLIDSSAYLFMFIATAATNMVASARADGDEAKSERIVGEALFLALCSGTVLASIVLAAGRPLLLAIAGQESAAVVPSALKYATVRAFGQPFVVMASVARAASLASKDTRGPLLSVALAFVLNAVGTVALVRGTSLGIMGAAIGTLCADIAATTFLLARLRTSRRKTERAAVLSDAESTTEKSATPLLVVPTMANLRRFLQYAAPIFFTILGKSVVYNGIAISVGRMGSVALAAHQVLLRNFFFWTPIGDSVGMTSQVFLPGILAEERKTGVPKPGAKRLLFGIGVLAGLCAATLAGLLPSKGAALFTTSGEIAAAMTKTAPILAFSVSMHAIALSCEGMLLAQRDLGFLSKSYVITTVATAALLLSPSRPATLGGSWGVLAIFQGSRALQFALRTLWISRRSKVKTA
jgi:Na+-driven multidrug efflux pump